MLELDHKEGWVPKNWCFWTVVLEKTLESPLYGKEINPVNHKGNQLWIFNGKLMLKLMVQCFGHLIQRVDSLEKTLMLGGIGGRRRGDDRGWDGWMASLTQFWMFIGRADVEMKLQYFAHLMWRADSFKKTLMLGKTEGERRIGQQDEGFGWHHRLNGHEFE